MKKFLALFCLLLFLIMVSCQMITENPVEGGLFSLVANWGRTIVKTSDSEEGVFIHPTSDGGFVSLIQTESDIGERMVTQAIKAVKLNTTGENDWVFSPLPDVNGGSTSGVFVLPNPFSSESRFLIGGVVTDAFYNDRIKLFYLDEEGNEIWQMEYPASGRDVPTGALFTSEYAVAVYGKTNSSDGVFFQKNQSTGYDGFVLEVNTLNGEAERVHFYDFNERDNGINRIYKTPDSPELFFVGEAKNAANVQKIWLMSTYNFHATYKSQALFANDDDFVYFFGGLRRTGLNEYVLASTKRMLDNEHMAFYKIRADASDLNMVIEILEEYEADDIIKGDARERSIGFSHFTDGNSLLAGVKAWNDALTLNRFFLIDTETFEIREQNYQYRQGVIYNHLSKKGIPQLYGLTGSIPSDDPETDKRIASGRACWVEGL